MSPLGLQISCLHLREREIAGAFIKHYANVSNYKPHIKISKYLLGCPPVYLNQELEDIFNSPFSHWELVCGIKQFLEEKCGAGGYLAEFLAHLGNEALGVLLKLINLTCASAQALLFADDLVLWSADGDIHTIQESLNTAPDALLTWSNNDEMTVNTSKTVFQVFTLSTKPKAIQLFYGDYQLQKTQEATYLGIVLDSRLSWNKQASRNKIETVQNNAFRIITGGAFSTPIQAMQLQANIEPLTFRRKRGALKFIERLKRHGDFWRNYNPAERRLKSQPTFLHVTKELSTDFDIPASNRQSLLETG
ncbi:putative RNA-directed DNA polymerase from transposon BS [Trichonephila clavata]|uniref:Putative RNA-directed DNA polymerase from transposon BS n=1 Tax=Trichonephila clavata TaxID=2740835 RepID=A0A8X6KQY2_TRICU|nr:putative RNA-directed DNA polymerase from transposon BS [Trichonephila clavata]